MTSARELLEQADALMRRNREDDANRMRHVRPDAERKDLERKDLEPKGIEQKGIEQKGVVDDPLRGFLPYMPTLDEADAVESDAALAPTVILPEFGADITPAPARFARDALVVPQAANAREPAGLAEPDEPVDRIDPVDRVDPAGLAASGVVASGVVASGVVASGVVASGVVASGVVASGVATDPAWLDSLSELPILTDVVQIGGLPLAATPELAPVPDSIPGSEATPRSEENPPVTDIASSEEMAQSEQMPPPASAGPQAGADWSALADEIRAQVLQRLDLFTDTGLREQLGARLRPIVDRASAELVDTITRQIGELVRGYVAEAIEREIEAWRNRNE